MNQSIQSKSSHGADEMLWGFWYPALCSEQVYGHKLVCAMLLEVPWCLVVTLREDLSRLAMCVLIVRSLCRSASSTAPRSNVPTTAGNSMHAQGSAAQSRH